MSYTIALIVVCGLALWVGLTQPPRVGIMVLAAYLAGVVMVKLA